MKFKSGSAGTYSYWASLQDSGPILIKGASGLPVSQLSAGADYRFRFINICPEELRLSISLGIAGKPVQWRAIAKDGADLPPQQATLREAKFNLGVGETYGFDFQPQAKATLTLEAKGETQTRTATLGVQ